MLRATQPETASFIRMPLCAQLDELYCASAAVVLDAVMSGTHWECESDEQSMNYELLASFGL